MSEARAVKVAGQIQREVATLLTNGKLKDDRIGFVTITDVRVTSDLMEAKIFYVPHGTEAEMETSARALHENLGRIRSFVGKAMKIQHVPSLRFVFDESVEYGARIEELLQEVRKKEGW